MRVFVVVAAGLFAGGVALADAPLATVAGRPITQETVEARVKPKLIEIETERYEALNEGLEEIITEELLKEEAKSRGVTVEQLTKVEIVDKVPAPTDADVQKLYDENKEALKNAPLEQVKPRLLEYMKQQSAAVRQEAFVDELKKKYKTTVALRPPTVEVGTGGRPVKGKADAPILIVEFSDYECPFCKRAEASVQEVLKAYPDKVKIVYRDYPLPFHASARPAAVAANCAAAQGKFWEYHEKLFASAELNAARFTAIADELKLDRPKFDACIAKDEPKAAIDKDIADASAVGVNGTPAFFINGRMISGAQPFDKFKEIIDQELQSSAQPKAS